MRPSAAALALAVTVGLSTAALTACSSGTTGSGTSRPPTRATTPAAVSEPVATSPVDPTSTTARPTAPSTAPSTAPPTTPPSTVPATAPTTSSPPSTTSTTQAGGTRTSVLRPVLAVGTPAPGWHVQNASVAVLCSPAQASPAAVNGGVDYCSPSAAYAIACWQAADRAHALCLVDGDRRTLNRVPLDGSFAAESAPRSRVPFDLLLDNGVRCRIRDGGAASNLTNHPDWIPFYYCAHDSAVYGPADGTGIDRSGASWTVQVGSISGESDTVTRRVVSARFVGTGGS